LKKIIQSITLQDARALLAKTEGMHSSEQVAVVVDALIADNQLGRFVHLDKDRSQ
jgi:hypothetical protein